MHIEFPFLYGLRKHPTIPAALQHEMEAWLDNAIRDGLSEVLVPGTLVGRALNRHDVSMLSLLAWLEMNQVSMSEQRAPGFPENMFLFRWGKSFNGAALPGEKRRPMVIATIHERPDDPPTHIDPGPSGAISVRVLQTLRGNGYTLDVHGLMVVDRDGIVRGPYTYDDYDPRGL